MALNIKDLATDQVARELAAVTGESLTEAIRIALTERLHRIKAQGRRSERARELRRYVARGRARQVLDERAAEQILGYDEHGLPR